MGTSLKGVWAPDGNAPIEPHVLANTYAASVADAMGGMGEYKAQPVKYSVANQSGKAVLMTNAVLRVGDLVHVRDTDWIEQKTETGWKVVRTLSPVAFTPNWTNPATSINAPSEATTQGAWYSIEGDMVTVYGYLNNTAGSQQFFQSVTYANINAPFPPAMDQSNVGILGWLSFVFGTNSVTNGMVIGMTLNDRIALQLWRYRNGAGGILEGVSSTSFLTPRNFTYCYTYRRMS